MLRDIINKELLENILHFKFILSFLVCVILFSTCAIIRVKDYQEQLRAYRSNVQLHHRAATQYKSAKDLAIKGIKIDHPPNPLSILVEGVSNSYPKTMTIALSSGFITDERAGKTALNLIFDTFDFVTLIQIVISLIAILFTYNAISGEREDGTLTLSLSNPLPRHTLILGKMVGNFLPLITTLLISLIAGLLIVVVMGGIEFDAHAWGRIGVIFLLSLLYLLLFSNMGIMVSVRSRSSVTSLILLLFLWVIFVFVIPHAGILLANYLKPVPTPDHIQEQKGMIFGMQMYQWSSKVEKYKEEHGVYPPKDVWDSREVERDLSIADGYRKVEEKFKSQVDAQVRVAKTISRFSPSSSLYYACSSLAGTSILNEKAYFKELEQYRSLFVDYSLGKMKKGATWSSSGEKLDLSGIPLLQVQPFYRTPIRKDFLVDFFLLVVFNLVFFLLAYFSFLKRTFL
ncbi:hypothetical protein CEE39_04670 [bacterium (candidate division B38) B3_B38]|nr:MAG: hypothetical protein CEE39_04670 [bacterium (candidate division B38) B3_B38]